MTCPDILNSGINMLMNWRILLKNAKRTSYKLWTSLKVSGKTATLSTWTKATTNSWCYTPVFPKSWSKIFHRYFKSEYSAGWASNPPRTSPRKNSWRSWRLKLNSLTRKLIMLTKSVSTLYKIGLELIFILIETSWRNRPYYSKQSKWCYSRWTRSRRRRHLFANETYITILSSKLNLFLEYITDPEVQQIFMELQRATMKLMPMQGGGGLF